MGFDLLNLGAQGVLTAQRQLNTTGHNISNVNTEGYSRQMVEQATNAPQYWADQNWGTGVRAIAVRRNYDQFAVNEMNLATTTHNYAADRDTQLALLNDVMANSASKIPDNINDFFGAVKALADTPNDMGSRKVVLEKAKLSAAALNDIQRIVQQQSFDTTEQIHAMTQRINQIGKELVEVHHTMIRTQGHSNDLMDRHDKLIKELSQYTKVTVTPRENDGLYNVMIGNGHMLVSGTQSSTLTTLDGKPDSARTQLALVEGKSVKAISKSDVGGKLGSLFEYRDQTIPMVQDELGRIAVGFAQSLNGLQNQGFDLNGEVGRNMFTDFNNDAIAANRVIKSGDSTADIKVYIDDLRALKGGDYTLFFDGSGYSLTKPDGNKLAVAPTGTPPTFEVDGLRVQVDAGLSPNEKVFIRPVRNAANEIRVTMDHGEQIATQSVISSASRLLGNAELKISAKGAQSEFQVVVSPDATQFAVLDKNGSVLVAPQSYPPAGPVNVNGTVFELSDGAEPEDVFAVSLNPVDGDNGNLMLMQRLQTQKFMNDGRSTIVDVFEGLNTEVGMQKNSFQRMREVTGVELQEQRAGLQKCPGLTWMKRPRT